MTGSKSGAKQIPRRKFKTITKKMLIDEKVCKFIVEDVHFVEMNGKEKMLDEEHIQNMVTEMAVALKRNRSKYNPLPRTIILSREDIETDREGQAEIIECIEPRFTFADVYLKEEAKRQLQSVLAITKHQKTLFEDWGLETTNKKGNGIILNFFGPPGTGKSMLAEAIANELKKKVFIVNYSELESKYVGETPKNIRRAFKEAKEEGAVLVFDEADSFLGKRLTNVNHSSDYGVNITRSVMLVEIEKFDGVVIFTTNLFSNYDEAFRRRILANIEFSYPDEEGREKIWRTHLPEQLPLADGITTTLLAARYEDISGADIKDIVLNAAVLTLQNEAEKISWAEFDEACHFIKKRYADSESDFMDENFD